MASQGPLSPGTLADDSAVGTVAWSNPGNASASDGSSAILDAGSGTSHYLKATNLGFSIPSGTIDGVVGEVERSSGPFGSAKDNIVKLVKGGVVSGNDKADTVTVWPATDTYKTYGSSSDLWGLTLTPADINATDFGMVISAVIVGGGPGAEGVIDHIRITVYYTAGAASNITGVQSITGIQSVTF